MYVYQDIPRPPVSANWLNFHEPEVSCFAPPKCGFSTVRRYAIRQVKPGEEDHNLASQKPKYDARYWVCRHPVDRFASMYANKILRRGEGPGNPGPWAEYGIKPEQVWLQVRFRYSMVEESGHRQYADMHWWRQSDFHGYWGTEEDIFVPTEALSVIIPEYPAQNVARGDEISLSDALRREISDFYAKDVEMYERALETDVDSLKPIIITNRIENDG